MPSGPPRQKQAGISLGLFAVLGFIGILGPFGTDAFAPALPEIASGLGATPGLVQFAFGAFGIGMALSQLVMGPLSDRFGRRLFLIAGTLIMAIGSLIAAVASNALILNLGCFVMGIGGAASVVIVWAVIADLTQGSESARGLAIVDMMVSLGPILGPLGGAAIVSITGWRGIFVGVGAYSILAALFSALFVRESLPKHLRTTFHARKSFAEFGSVLRNRNFLLRFGSLLATFGILFAYIGASPFLLMGELGLSIGQYSLTFALNGAGIIFANLMTAWLTRRIALERILGFGVLVQFGAAAFVLALVLTQNYALWLIIPALFVLVASFGFVFGAGTALAIEEVRENTGSALAILGSSQFFIGAVTMMAIGLGDSAVMMSWIGALLGAFSVGCLVAAKPAASDQSGFPELQR